MVHVYVLVQSDNVVPLVVPNWYTCYHVLYHLVHVYGNTNFWYTCTYQWYHMVRTRVRPVHGVLLTIPKLVHVYVLEYVLK